MMLHAQPHSLLCAGGEPAGVGAEEWEALAQGLYVFMVRGSLLAVKYFKS